MWTYSPPWRLSDTGARRFAVVRSKGRRRPSRRRARRRRTCATNAGLGAAIHLACRTPTFCWSFGTGRFSQRTFPSCTHWRPTTRGRCETRPCARWPGRRRGRTWRRTRSSSRSVSTTRLRARKLWCRLWGAGPLTYPVSCSCARARTTMGATALHAERFASTRRPRAAPSTRAFFHRFA